MGTESSLFLLPFRMNFAGGHRVEILFFSQTSSPMGDYEYYVDYTILHQTLYKNCDDFFLTELIVCMTTFCGKVHHSNHYFILILNSVFSFKFLNYNIS